jgi:ABC-type branched-subunit amino acid transport system substrate-binding protein
MREAFAFARLGVPGLNGIKLASNQINQSGGLLGHKLHLVTAEDQIDPSTARQAAPEPG